MTKEQTIETLQSSIRNKKWLKRTTIKKYTTQEIKRSIPQKTLELVSLRDTKNLHIEDFLFPTFKAILPNPMHLLDMQVASQRICNAIYNNEKIAVLADYDVDGTSSAAILKQYMKSINQDIIIYIPNRIKEGYGPNCNAFKTLKQNYNISLCITVDCGIVSYNAINTANSLGIDVIIADHHIGQEKMPSAFAIVNPNRYDETSDQKNLSAAGIVFLMLIAIHSNLKKTNFFSNISEPNLINLLDLVALSIVCDIVPLSGTNRLFVKKGLELINKKQGNIGIQSLIAVSGIKFPISEQSLGFYIGPRINACGRISDGSLAVELLSSNNYEEAYQLATKIDILNNIRKNLDSEIFDEIKNIIDTKKQNNVIMLANKNWHPGVIGIVAGRIKDEFNAITIIMTIDENGIGKASMRGINDFNCGSAVHEAVNMGLIKYGGGHAAAAGFSMDIAKFDELNNFFNNTFNSNKQINHNEKISFFDLTINPNEVNIETFNAISLAGPFGKENPEPILLIKNVTIMNIKILKNKHIMLIIDATNKLTFKALLFNATETTAQNLIAVNKKITIIGSLALNTWNNINNIDFIIHDIVI